MKNLQRCLVIVSIVLLGAINLSAQEKQTVGEQEIRAADAGWARVFGARDLQKSVDYCDASASVLAPNAPIATGKEAIATLFTGFFSLPELKITWQATRVGLARSGELGYSTGAYQMSFKDPSGKAVEDHGKYVTLWQKQANGQWKVTYDIFNSDLPAAP
jgi:ketosteroid isomerase-like protein